MVKNLRTKNQKIARSLSFVFAQLKSFGLGDPETRAERAAIREKLREDLKASVELCNSKKATE